MTSTWTSARAPNMKGRLWLGIVTASLVAASGCSTLEVRSLPAPNADFGRRATFRIVERQIPVDSVRPIRSETVMLNNSIIDQIVRDDVRRAFEARGYAFAEADPDFDVAYSAMARERIKINRSGYRYRYHGYRDAYEYTEGTVVLDVIDPSTRELLWRGSGIATVSDNPNKYAKQLNKAIDSIVERFPPAMPRLVTTREEVDPAYRGEGNRQ